MMKGQAARDLQDSVTAENAEDKAKRKNFAFSAEYISYRLNSR